MPRKPEYTGVSLKEELAVSIDDFLREHPTLAYRSLTQFVEDAARRRLEQLQAQIKELPRFEQINTDENGIKILDRQLHRVVEVHFKPTGVRCSYDQASSCEHVTFAFHQTEVRKVIDQKRREGWKIDLPEE
jgi:hypothetical protein